MRLHEGLQQQAGLRADDVCAEQRLPVAGREKLHEVLAGRALHRPSVGDVGVVVDAGHVVDPLRAGVLRGQADTRDLRMR